MTQIFHNMIAAILGISEKQIGQTLSLLNDGDNPLHQPLP